MKLFIYEYEEILIDLLIDNVTNEQFETAKKVAPLIRQCRRAKIGQSLHNFPDLIAFIEEIDSL